MPRPRIAVISALHEELAEVLALMPDQQPVRLAGRNMWVGHIHGHKVVATLSGIGKVAAATTASVLLQHFQVPAVLFTGVAGGLGTGVRVGDIVVGTQFVQHDMNAAPLFPQYEMPGYDQVAFAADQRLSQMLCQAATAVLAGVSDWLTADVQHRLGLQTPVAHQGLLLTGDRFVATSVESAALSAALPNALAVDMETAAVAQVCHDFAVPFGAVRTISDRADDAAHIDFPVFLQEVARHYSVRVLQQALLDWKLA